MKLKINQSGSLEIERATGFKPQTCIFSNVETVKCGDWCPKFSEPELMPREMLVQIGLCHNDCVIASVEDFIDERSEESKQAWSKLAKQTKELRALSEGETT